MVSNVLAFLLVLMSCIYKCVYSPSPLYCICAESVYFTQEVWKVEYECCLCSFSFFIYLFIFMFLFFQNSANDNDIDNNANNKDHICQDTNDSESSEYESDVSDDEIDVEPQPQLRSICGLRLARGRGGGFSRHRTVGTSSQRANRVGSAHAVPREANQPVTWSDITDFENPNVDKLFHEHEGPDRLSMLAETMLDCFQ